MSIESVMTSNHLILCRPLLFLPAYKRTYTIQTCVVQSSLSVPPYQDASVLSIGLCLQFSSVQSLSHVQLFATPLMASLSITNSRSLPKLMSVESMMPSSHLIHCRPLLLLPPIPPSIKVFSNELTLHMRWPKYWSFSLSISPSN